MLEVIARDDGTFAVLDTADGLIVSPLGVFATAVDADEFMLRQQMLSDEHANNLGIMRPGGNQGLT